MTDVQRRAVHAQQLLGDELIKEAFDTLEEHLVNTWINAPEADMDGRERCYRELHGLRAFKAHFVRMIETGSFEAKRQEQEDQIED